MPLSLLVTGANTNDGTMLEALVDDIPKVCTPRGGRRHRPVKVHADKGVRHEAPCDRVGWKDPPLGCRSSPVEAGGSLTWEAPGRVGAAPTTTGRSGTARRAGSGKQGRMVQRRVNQWWNPRKRRAGSNLVDVGRPAAHAGHRRSWCLATPEVTAFVPEEATRKVCGVLVARLPGKSWTPPLPTGTR
jgi:hypothetical protein